MCSKTMIDKIRNEHVLKHLGAASIDDKLKETHLKWFGHISRAGQLRCG